MPRGSNFPSFLIRNILVPATTCSIVKVFCVSVAKIIGNLHYNLLFKHCKSN